MTDEQKALFMQYDDAIAKLVSITNVDSFIEGYRFGRNLILAAFTEHANVLKQIFTNTDLGGNDQ